MSWRVLVFLSVLAAALSAAGLLLLGIPGFFWTALAESWTGPYRQTTDGWPQALTMSVVWPWFLPLSYLVLASLIGPGLLRWLAILVTTVVASIAAAAWVRTMSW